MTQTHLIFTLPLAGTMRESRFFLNSPSLVLNHVCLWILCVCLIVFGCFFFGSFNDINTHRPRLCCFALECVCVWWWCLWVVCELREFVFLGFFGGFCVLLRFVIVSWISFHVYLIGEVIVNN